MYNEQRLDQIAAELPKEKPQVIARNLHQKFSFSPADLKNVGEKVEILEKKNSLGWNL